MQIEKELKKLANPEKAPLYQRFFKTGPGEYGEGDIFLGITMPQVRSVAKKYFQELNLQQAKELVSSKYHEFRMCTLVMLVYKYEKYPEQRKDIYHFFLNNTKHINNWDLVDVTIPKTVGNYLINNNRSILYKLVKSTDLWERRISVLATFAFIKNNDFKDSIKIAKLLLKDQHDLIHKAVKRSWEKRPIPPRTIFR